MKTFASRLVRLFPVTYLLLAAFPLIAAAGDISTWVVINTGSPANPESILSTDVMEKNRLVHAGWHVSGAGVLQGDEMADAGQVFRMFRPLPKGGVVRMFAVSKEEADARTKVGYVTEGALGYVSLKAGAGMVPVIRFSKEGKYLWVISAADQDWAEKAGWRREKVAFWLWPNTYNN